MPPCALNHVIYSKDEVCSLGSAGVEALKLLRCHKSIGHFVNAFYLGHQRFMFAVLVVLVGQVSVGQLSGREVGAINIGRSYWSANVYELSCDLYGSV